VKHHRESFCEVSYCLEKKVSKLKILKLSNLMFPYSFECTLYIYYKGDEFVTIVHYIKLTLLLFIVEWGVDLVPSY
jgi:hypothetical protein